MAIMAPKQDCFECSILEDCETQWLICIYADPDELQADTLTLGKLPAASACFILWSSWGIWISQIGTSRDTQFEY